MSKKMLGYVLKNILWRCISSSILDQSRTLNISSYLKVKKLKKATK